MSGRKLALPSYKLISAGDMSANITSPVTNIELYDNIAFQVNILTGSAAGTIAAQVSLDYLPSSQGTPNSGTWITILSATVTAGAVITGTNILVTSGNGYLKLNQVEAPWIRLLFTNSSSTGTMDAFICGKMI